MYAKTILNAQRYTNQLRIQINFYNHPLTYNIYHIQVHNPQVIRVPNNFYKLLKFKFLLLKTFCFI